MPIRTLDTDHRFSQLSSNIVAMRLRALHPGKPLNILALSGGGAAGAFGAGAVAGLTRSATLPDFAVVTGVSAGALLAPYAFLGPTWDARLRDAFTGGSGDHLLQSRGLGAVFGSSLYRGAPLKHLVDSYLSDAMIRAVAREADTGRLLLVATTDVATGEPVVWDLGSIARNGGPSARTLFRDVLVASASVPGVFPPVIIRVQEDGAPHDEAHVDGAATMPFFVPPAFVQTPNETLDHAHRTAVYVHSGWVGPAAADRAGTDGRDCSAPGGDVAVLGFRTPTPVWIPSISGPTRWGRSSTMPTNAHERDGSGQRSGAPATMTERYPPQRRRRRFHVLPTTRSSDISLRVEERRLNASCLAQPAKTTAIDSVSFSSSTRPPWPSSLSTAVRPVV